MEIKSLLIGAISAMIIFITLGAGVTKEENQVGTYQGFATDEQQYIINTKTGEIYTLGIVKLSRQVGIKNQNQKFSKNNHTLFHLYDTSCCIRHYM